VVTVDNSASQNTDNSNGAATPAADANTSATVSITAISNDSGTSTSDFITNDQTLSYSGTVSNFTANGAAVQLVLTNAAGAEVGRTFVTPAANGSWTWDNTGVNRADGNYTLTATVVDAAGNRTNTAAGGQDSQVVTIDTDAGKNTDNGSGTATPQTDANATDASIGITTIVDSALSSNDTGTSDTDLITQDRTLAIKGTVGNFVTTGASAGDTVRVQIVKADGTIAREGFVTPDSAGNWTLNNTANSLDDGVYTLKAAILDRAGNTIKAAVDKTLVIDNSASANPGNNNATDTNNGSTASVSVTAIDDGNNATNNTNGSKDNGTFNNDFVTNDNTLVIKGTTANFSATGATNGDRVRVQLLDEAGTTVVAQAFVLPDSNGAWTWDRTGTQQADGKYNLKADIVDAAGNVVKAGNTQPLVIDTSVTNNIGNGAGSAGADSNATSALTLAITSINDTTNGSSDTGSSGTDFITNDQTLVIQGTAVGFSNSGAQAGDQLRVQLVKADGTLVRSAFVTVDSSGNWSLDNTANTLDAGTYTIKADVMDLAGNTVKSTTQALVVDVSNNELVTANFINKDTPSNGTSGVDVSNTDWKVYTDGVTRGQTIFTSIGSGETITKAEISLDGGSTWTAGEVTGDLAKFFINNVFATSTTSIEYQFRTTDIAGNLSAVSTKTITIQDLASNTSATSITTESETVLPTTTTAGTSFRGDDKKQTFTANADTIANYLVDATPSANWVNAGGGMDTLKVIGADATLNLNKLTTEYNLSKLQGFEVIDLKSDTAAQTVIGSGLAFASFGNSTWLTNSSLLAGYQVVIRGDAADTLVLSPGDAYDTTGWVKGAQITGAGTNVFSGIKFDVWSNASLNVQLLVEELVVVSNKFVSFDAISTDTGTSNTDLITTDTTLAFSGAVSGTVNTDIVKVTVLNSSNAKVVDNVTASVNNGIWTLDNQANDLALGDYTVKTTITNAAGTVLATGQDRIVKVIGANAAPINTVGANRSTDEDTALTITGLSVADSSNNGDNYTVTLGVTNGTLTVSGGSATISGSGTNTVTLSGTRSAINATLGATVSFAPTANFNGSAQLTMSTNDGSLGDAKTDSDSVTITVNSVNDAPVVTPSTTARSYAENAGAIKANDTLTLSDADTANLTGATVQITSGLNTGDVLGFVDANGISGSYNAGTGKLTLSGTATVAQYQAALQSVTYVNTGDNPTTTQRTLSWQVNDGQSANNLSNVGTSTIDVTVSNDAPTGVNDSASATEAGGANNGTAGTNPTGNALTNDTDPDNANSALSVKDIKAGTAAGAGTAVTANTTSANGTSITGSFGTLKIGANGSYVYTVDNTNATVQALNTTSTALSDVFTYTLQDAAGLTSTATITVSVNGANDAPVLANAISDTTGTEESALSFVVPANAFSDVDNSSLTLSATLANGNALPSWLTFTASTRTFSGTPPVGAGTVSVKVTASDGALSVSDDFDIVVNPANAAPVANPTSVTSNAISSAEAVEVTITDNQSAARVANGTEVTFTLKFSQAITASSLTASDIVVDNGTIVANSLTQVDATTWTVKATAAATGSNSLAVSLADGSYTSVSGASGIGNSATQAFGASTAQTALSSVSVAGSAAGERNFAAAFNTNTIATLADGGWISVVGRDENSIFFQRYDASGAAVGAVRTVATVGSGDSFFSGAVDVLSDGGFIVNYSKNTSTGVRTVLFQRYDEAGTAVGSPVTYGENNFSKGAALGLESGGWVAVATGNDSSGNLSDAIFTVYNANGVAVNSNQRVNFDSSRIELYPVLTRIEGGGFAMASVLATTNTISFDSIQLQRYDDAGVAVGSRVLVAAPNREAGGTQVASASFKQLKDGSYVLIWSQALSGGAFGSRLFLQKLNSNFELVGSSTQISTPGTNLQDRSPDLVALEDGGYAIAWTRSNFDSSISDVLTTTFDAQGNSTSGISTVSSVGFWPSLAALPTGGYVINYTSSFGSSSVDVKQSVFGAPGSVITSGTTGTDTLAGGNQDDNINITGSSTLAGGADRVLAGAGNDTVTIDGNTRTALVDTSATTANMLIDGGSGINQLIFSQSGSNLDLTNNTVRSKLRNFSTFDITGTGNTTLKVDYDAVVNMSGATDNPATTADESKLLVVNGNAGDTVQVVNLSSWSTSAATQTAAALTATYGSAYQFKAGSTYKKFTRRGATLFVENTVTVSTITSTELFTGQAVSVQTLFGSSFTDVNSGQTFKGVAITNAGVSADLTGKGKYQISTDGTTWTDLAAGLNDTNAVYAAPTALIRFVGVSGVDALRPQDLSVRLIDSSGLTGTGGTLTTGQTINASVNGGFTAFSGNTLTLAAANTAPVSTDGDGVIGGNPLGAAVTAGTPAKTVAQLFSGVYSDDNADAMAGVVVTSAGTAANLTALGKYQFSSNNGSTWTDLAGGLTDSTSVYLAKTDLVRFVPSSTNTSSTAKQALTVRLVDDSLVSGNFTSGATVNLSNTGTGGITAISGNTVSLGAVVDPNPNLNEVLSAGEGFVINSQSTGDRLGFTVTNAGDVNGDGFDDVLLGAPDAVPGSATGAGKSYVVYGGSAAATVDLSALGTKGFVINGESTVNGFLGTTISAAGDINGDGLADVFMGSFNNASGKGRAYVVFGKTGNAATNLSDVAGGTGGFAIDGATVGEFIATSVRAAGDVNGDGFADLLIGAGSADTTPNDDSGRAYVVFGKSNNTKVELSALGTQGFVIQAASAGDRLGDSVSQAGDVNGDGLSDLVLLAPNADPSTGDNAGAAYVVFGKANNTALNVSSLTAGTGTQGFVINGFSANEGLNVVSNVGDVNGDGLADVIVASANADPAAGTNAGRAYVVFGKTGGAAVNVSAVVAGSGGFAINGLQAGERVEFARYAGDINGDGLADMIVGAKNSDPVTGTNAGRSYVVYGKTGTSAIELSAVNSGTGGFTIVGVSASDGLGVSASYAGDVNGDGFDDLIVGADRKDVGSTGKAYVIFGGSRYAGTVDFLGNASANTLTGSQASETFVGGDGNDTLVGAGGADVMFGGRGNDTFVLNAGNANALQNNLGSGNNTTQLARVDGGTGYDTLRLSDGASLDMTRISAVNASGTDGTSRLDSIERIDLATDTASNTLTLSGRDVADKAGFNLIKTGSVSADGKTWTNVTGTALGASNAFHQLVVDGTSADNLNLTGTWTQVGTVSDGSAGNFVVLQNDATRSQVIARAALDLGLNRTISISGVVVNDTGTRTTEFGVVDVLKTEVYTDSVVEVRSFADETRAYEGVRVDNFLGQWGSGTDEIFNGGNDMALGFVDAFFNNVLGQTQKAILTSKVGNFTTVSFRYADVQTETGYSGLTAGTVRFFDANDMEVGSQNLLANTAGSGSARTFTWTSTGASAKYFTISIPRTDGWYMDTLAFSSGAGTLPSNEVTLDNTPQLQGSLNVALSGSQVVKIFEGATEIGTAAVSGTNWTFQFGAGSTGTGTTSSTVSAGQHTYTARVMDGATVVSSSGNFVINVASSVAPVVLDLNRDGELSYAKTVMDVNSDGVIDSTLWAGVQDGVLVWDKYHDGRVHDHMQYAFTEYGGSTDLEGLAAGFDSNRDGVFNAADDKFDEFTVWQDANGNGVSDAGEVRSLADLGITEINLLSDGVVRTPVDGVKEAGQSTAQLVDGSSMLVADAAFEFHTASAAEAASHTLAQGESVFRLFSGMSLDLSAVTDAGKLTEVNALADTAANTIKLTLADVLGAGGVDAVSGVMHQLKLTGDANDTAVFSANEWTNTGSVVTEQGHNYAVYNAANDASAQLLVDQHMLVSHNG
jgi:VCBS repeat-containing protein